MEPTAGAHWNIDIYESESIGQLCFSSGGHAQVLVSASGVSL